MSAIAFIVNPVNPKVGVIFTSPCFPAMKSPLFILYFCAQPPRTEPANAEARDTRGVERSSKMQRFDGPNHRFGCQKKKFGTRRGELCKLKGSCSPVSLPLF